jgi:hypothetical protein
VTRVFDLDIDSTELFYLSVSTSTWHSTGRAPMETVCMQVAPDRTGWKFVSTQRRRRVAREVRKQLAWTAIPSRV